MCPIARHLAQVGTSKADHIRTDGDLGARVVFLVPRDRPARHVVGLHLRRTAADGRLPDRRAKSGGPSGTTCTVGVYGARRSATFG